MPTLFDLNLPLQVHAYNFPLFCTNVSALCCISILKNFTFCQKTHFCQHGFKNSRMFLGICGGDRIQKTSVKLWVFGKASRHHTTMVLLVPGVVRENRLVVVLQDFLDLSHDVEPPVVQNLSQVGHAAHVHPLSWVKNSGFMSLH